MRIIKRSGEEQEFNPQKISVAIGKANDSVPKSKQFPKNYIPAYTAQAVAACENLGHTPTVQEVQDIVEDLLRIRQEGRYQLRYTVDGCWGDFS